MNTHIEMLVESTVENGRSILAATLVVQGQDEKPHRIVLRYWQGEYVTHREYLNKTCMPPMGDPCVELFEHESYDQGHYFGQNFSKAMLDFAERAGAALHRLTHKEF